MSGNTATSYFIEIVILSIFVSQTHQVRKYDLEAECLKLYKEDLATVLLRFRRSPEYIKILEEKTSEFQIHVNDVKNQLVYFYNNKLGVTIAGLLGYGVEKVEEEEAEAGAEKPSGLLIRRASKMVDPNNISCVERLDSYSSFNSPLTVVQRNNMRNLGFTYAGHMIHALIKNMGTYQDDKKSTVFDSMGRTQHVSVHVVRSGDSDEAKAQRSLTTTPAAKKKQKTTTLQKRFVHKQRV